jgi:iron-sulfur cluster assembly protein
MSLTFTEAVSRHIQRCIAKQGSGIGMRLRLKPSGCSGYKYEMDIAETTDQNDVIFEAFNAKIIVDKKTLALVDGTRLDYQQRGLNWEIVLDNPRAHSKCGCGESFSLDETP